MAAPIDAADGAGTIVIINRSIGPDQSTPRPDGDRAYIASQRFPLPGAFSGGRGAFRSPSPLPSGRLLVACDRDATDLTSGGYDFDCNGTTARQWTDTVMGCSPSGGALAQCSALTRTGWLWPVPECGAVGEWASTCDRLCEPGPGGKPVCRCDLGTELRRQACR